MESDPTRMCELLVGLPEMNGLSVVDEVGDLFAGPRRDSGVSGWMWALGVLARVKERPVVELVDLPCFGRSTSAWCGTSVGGAAPRRPVRRAVDRGETSASGMPAWP